MFAAGYFAPRYFAPRYWPKVGGIPVVTTPIAETVVGLISTVNQFLGLIDDSALNVAGPIAQDSITGIIDPDAINIRGLMQ
jgi:hypothetical protein